MSSSAPDEPVAAPAARPERPRRRATRRPGRRRVACFLLVACLYLVLGYLSRLTRLEGTSVSLVWLAGGLATTWLVNQRTRAGALAVLGFIAAAVPLLLVSTGSREPVFVLCATAANVTQTALFVVLLGAWERRRPMPRESYTFELVLRSVLCAAAATAVAAAMGTTGLVFGPGTPDAALAGVQWWARNLLGIVVVGSLTHITFVHLRRDHGLVRSVFWERRGELGAVFAVSVVTYALILGRPEASLTFLVLPIAVWLGWRFPIWVATVHATVWGSVVGTATILGAGPFAQLDHVAGALVLQLFLFTTLLTSLLLAGLQAQRDRLIADLVRAEREVAQRAELLDVMTETMSEGLLVVKGSEETVRANRAARRLLDQAVFLREEGEHSQVRLTRVDGSELPEAELPSSRVRAEGQVAPYDVGLPLRSGGRRIISVSASPLQAGPLLHDDEGLMVVFRDVTEDREQRNQLARFAGTVAHDLRSPLTAVRGWLELAEGEAEAMAAASQATGVADVRLGRTRNGIARARQSAAHMSRLIEDLLAQATAEGAELTLVPVELDGEDGMVAEIVELLGTEADVVVDDLPPVEADHDMVRQLLANLLGNAVKYVEPGTRPRIEVTASRRGGRVVVAVTDNGVGIPAGQHELVLERFHRAHAGDPRFTGTGLGLAICKTIVERHGGTLTAAPGPDGVGTTFRFDLAAARSEPSVLTATIA